MTRVLGGRYENVRVIKTGNGVETVVARDATDDADVVVKSVDLGVIDAATRRRFEHEIQILRTLLTLGLPGLLDTGIDDGRLFLVQPFLRGRPLDQVLGGGALPVPVAMRVVRDIAQALDIAHGAGICHRDVKPANIIIAEDDGSAMLVDFGFARSAHLDSAIRDDMVGTIRYLAPESAGLLAIGPDERSDLYALGVVLFECLVGHLPYGAPTVGELLREHLSAPVPSLRAANTEVPRAVEALVHRLLRKDPDERYQSAAALATDLTALIDALESGIAEPRFVIGRFDRRNALTDASFVGRDDELATLSEFVAGISRGSGGALLLEADSGGGKSRLLQELTADVERTSIRVLRGQGVALAGQRPFAMLHGVADELVATLTDAEKVELRAVLAGVAPSIVRALPALAEVLDAADAQDTGPEEFGELRSLAALQALLRALCKLGRPVLLVLDDCQWADTPTIRLISELFADGPPKFFGVVVAFRANEVSRNHALRRINGAQRLRLRTLTGPVMEQLAESMAGPLPRTALDLVVRLADGNPFMGAAVLRGMVETGVLIAGDQAWSVDPDRLQDVQAARRSAVFLVRRLERLSDDALRLLSVGAVLGKQFDLDVVLDIAGPSVDAMGIIKDAKRGRLLWDDEESGRWRFFHDKIREALIERLDVETRRELHGRAADALVRRADTDPEGFVFDLAYHLDAAGRPADALPYARAAAQLSRDRYALDTSVMHYRMAAAAVDEADVATRLSIAEGLGEVLTLQGVYAEAAEQVKLAHSLVTEPADAAALEGKLGELSFKTGDFVGAKKYLEGALERLGGRVPRSNLTFVLSVLWESVIQAAHTIAPRWFVGRRADLGGDVDFLAMRLYSQLAYLYWFHSGRVPCAWAHLRGLNLAERYGQSAELGQAYSEHAPVMTMIPWYSRGRRYAARSLEVRRALGDVWGQGQSLSFTAIVNYAASDWERALESTDEARRLLERTGDQWEVNTVRWNVALCEWRLGRLADAAATARATYQSAYEIGDLSSAGIALSIWTRAERGDIDIRLVDDLLATKTEDAQATAELNLASALAHRHSGDLGAAVECIKRGIDVIENAGLRQEYIAPLFPWLATVLRERAERTSALHPHARAAARREAEQAARRARRWARSYRNNAPHAYRESALVAALAGHPRRARRWMRRSAAIATAQGAAYELAQTRLALALLDDPTETSVDLFDARAELAAFESGPVDVDRVMTLSQQDRFATLLDIGRAITAAPSKDTLEAVIREATCALLRTDRCHIVPVTMPLEHDLVSQSGGPIEGLSRALVAKALDTRAPAVSLDLRDDTNESLVLAGVRSALAAPITVGGVPTACLYVSHRDIGHLFGEEEVQLASFIATLAGAAYEHVAGSETRFRALVQHSSDVITLVDPDGTVQYQSSSIASEFGFTSTEFAGRSITDWVHPDDRGTLIETLGVAGDIADTRLKLRLSDASGEFRDCEMTITDLRSEPTVGAIVLTTHDITERTTFENALVEKNAALERASQAKDMFLASMSHELRTPLNAIMGFTGTFLMRLPGELNDDQERQLMTVEQNSKHLLSIINDLLDLARIESGEVQLTLEEVDCAAVVNDVMTTMGPLAAKKSLALSADVPPGVLRTRSDERALSQILINLINNAIKFTDVGGVRVVVRTAESGTIIRVEDTGPGIEDADRERIFSAFTRAKNGLRRAREGTGLGLHISQRLADLIGAHIEVDTVVGFGTAFTVSLPPLEDSESAPVPADVRSA